MGTQEDEEGLVEPRASQRPVGGILMTPPLGKSDPLGGRGGPLGQPPSSGYSTDWKLATPADRCCSSGLR